MAAPDSTPTCIQFTIAGPRGFGATTGAPIWTAQAELLAWTTQTGGQESPWASAAARNLFVSWPATPGPAGTSLRPGLILVRCRISSAQLNLGGILYDLQDPQGAALADAVLLLEARSDRWAQPQPVLQPQSLFPGPIDSSCAQFRCLGGEFPIAYLTQSGAGGTARVIPPPWASHFPMLSQLQNLSLTAGGLAMEGCAAFPWKAAPISNARYLVQVQLAPSGKPSAPLLVVCDRERLRQYDPATSDLIAVFARLAALLAPPRSASDPARLLKWFSLEPATSNTVPEFSWDLTPSATPGIGATAVLRLDSGWRLYLTDQPPRAPGVPGIAPLGVLSTNPALTIAGGGNQPLTINIATAPPAASASLPSATYSYQSSSGVESLTVTNITTVYDPVSVAQIVRGQYGVDAPASALLGPATPATAAGTPAPGSPESAAGDVPLVLWAFVPLEDGWVQLPVVNLTEQTILDNIAPPTAPPSNAAPGLFTGAASFGNDRAELYPLTGGREQPWNLTILDALNYAGSISLTGGGTSDNWVISRVQLTLYNPELELNGFLWLGLTPPTAADAIPDLVNWLACLERISLRTMRDVETFPSPFVLPFDSISFTFCQGALGPHAEVTPSLGPWKFSYNGNSALATGRFGSAPVFVILWPTVTGGKPVWTYLPLVWRRHPSSPAIQSLPLTQSASPPNYPSPSRQLAPFELAVDTNGFPSGWTFQAAGATSWPVLVTAANPAPEWAELGGLPLASLGLPGLTFDPSELPGLIAQNVNLAFLNAQYRYGLPYLDEVHALSTPPRDDPQSGDTTDNLPPPVLLRESYADHWSRLSTLAFFAAADADQVLVAADGKNAGNGVVAAGAFEPFLWAVTASLDLATSPYPGKLTLSDTGSGQAMVLGEIYTAIDLTGNNTVAGAATAINAAGMDLTATVEPRQLVFQLVPTTAGTLVQLRTKPGDATTDILSHQSGQPALSPVFAGADTPVATSTPPVLELAVGNKTTVLNLAANTNNVAGTVAAVNASGLAVTATALPPAASRLRIDPTGPVQSVQLRSIPGNASSDLLTHPAPTGTAYGPDVPAGGPVVTSSPPVVELVAFGADALGGLDGLFTVASGTLQLLAPPVPPAPRPAGSFAVVAGSVGTTEDSANRLRDQRGLWRAASVVGTSGTVVKTDLQLEGVDAVRYYSALGSLELDLGSGSGGPWRFWFRDVPTTGASTPESGFTFDRAKLPPSAQRRGSNDPAAMSRALVHRTGYEWRLSADCHPPAATPEDVVLPLGPLSFCPLELAVVSFAADDSVSDLEIVGLLQLPLPAPPRAAQGPTDLPRPELGNAVRLTFAPPSPGAPLALAAIALEPTEIDPDGSGGPALPPLGRWPLDAQSDADVDPPVLTWDTISYDPKTNQVTLNKVTLSFAAHGAIWTVAAPAKVSFPLATTSVSLSFTLGAPTDPGAVVPLAATLALELNAPGANHYTLLICWQFRWGDPTQLNLVVLLEEARLDGSTAKSTATFGNAAQGFSIALDDVNVTAWLDEGSVVVQFDVNPTKLQGYQLLPGMHLAPQAGALSGFAALTFTIIEQAGSIPTFTTGAAHIEAIVQCEWGSPLQDAALGKPATDADQIYGSSAGQLAVSYCVNLAAPQTGAPGSTRAWLTQLVFNGALEVRNLVSWPSSLQAPPADPSQDNIFVLPAAHPSGSTLPPLHHARHTARILFNQHAVATTDNDWPFTFSSDSRTFFEVAAGAVWQPLAVVEHQIVNIAEDTGGALATVGGEMRWTTAQEVRFCGAATFRSFLTELYSDSSVVAFLPQIGSNIAAWTASTLWFCDSGYHTAALLQELADPQNQGANAALKDDKLGPLMIVEASAHSLVRTPPAGGLLPDPAPTNLQYLPFGTQQALLAPPVGNTLVPSSADFPPWLVVSLPFIGRMQAQGLDGVTATPAGVSLVRVDPILQIDRARRASSGLIPTLPLHFASWSDTANITVPVAEFDLPRQRLLVRPEPSALYESWFRLTTPDAPALSPGPDDPLAGIAASFTSDSPAALSRPARLTRLIDPRRVNLPPVAFLGAPSIEPLGRIAWRPGSLFVTQNGFSAIPPSSGPGEPPSHQVLARYGFFAIGLQIAQSALLPTPQTSRSRYTAATLVPSVLLINQGNGLTDNPQPVGLAACPYTGIAIAGSAASGTVKAGDSISSSDGSANPDFLIDQNPSTVFISPSGDRVTITPSAGVTVVTGIGLTNPPTGSPGANDPTGFTLSGSNDGKTFTQISKGKISAFTSAGQTQTISFNNAASYTVYQIVFTNGGTVSLAELQLLGAVRLLVVADLVGTDPQRMRCTSLASQLWQDVQVTDQVILDWAAQTRNRMAPDSPIAVARLSELFSTTADVATGLTIQYRFLVVDTSSASTSSSSDSTSLAVTLRAKRAVPLRAETPRLRFVEGQYGGDQVPKSLKPFETAPPQVRGVQPIRRPNGVGGSGPPWGYSALWLSTWQTDAATGIAGVVDPKAVQRVWWESTYHHVAFQTTDPVQPHKLLPTLFRARPIASYLPAWPRSPLPQADDLGIGDWQPVLAGGHHVFVSGARPGAIFIVREHLQTQLFDPAQAGGNALAIASGSVPCQHRFPRPVRIPDNPTATPPAVPDQSVALQTWGTYFDAQTAGFDGRDLLVTKVPADSAFFAPQSGPLGMLLTLVTLPPVPVNPLVGATIPPNWGGRVVAVAQSFFPSNQQNWDCQAQLVYDTTAIQLTAIGPAVFKSGDPITSSDGSANPGNAIDQNPATVFTTRSGDQLTIMPSVGATIVIGIAVTNPPTGSPGANDPAGFTISGSNDGSTFTTISTGTINAFSAASQTQTVPFVNAQAYLTYRIVLTNSGGMVSVAELQLVQTLAFEVVAQADLLKLQNWQASKRHGSPATLQLTVSPPPGALAVANVHQTLSFPLRVAVADQDPLPLEPTFVLFEDPEYNRLLSSLTARASAVYKQGSATCTVSFATDRREYNNTGTINYLYYLEPNPVSSSITLGPATLTISSVSSRGVATTLIASISMQPKSLPTTPGVTDILTIRGGGTPGAAPAPLSPADKLRFDLTIDPGSTNPTQVALLVDIVAQPVTPALESGFALLRGGQGGSAPIECVRFAWGALPDRIELVDPDDLMNEVVRRRAVFRWSDTVRVGCEPSYAIQKIAPFGSTHFPKLHGLSGQQQRSS